MLNTFETNANKFLRAFSGAYSKQPLSFYTSCDCKPTPPRLAFIQSKLAGTLAQQNYGSLEMVRAKTLTGDVLQDYGTIQDERIGITKLRTSVLLCRKEGKLKLMFRQTATAPLGARVSYVALDLNAQNLQLLERVVLDGKQKLATSHLPPPLC